METAFIRTPRDPPLLFQSRESASLIPDQISFSLYAKRIHDGIFTGRNGKYDRYRLLAPDFPTGLEEEDRLLTPGPPGAHLKAGAGADDVTGGRASEVKGPFHQVTYEHTREGPSSRRRHYFFAAELCKLGSAARGHEGERARTTPTPL